MIDAATMTSLLKAVQSGQMSQQEFFELMQRGDVIESEKTYEEHQDQVDAQGPARPPTQQVAA